MDTNSATGPGPIAAAGLFLRTAAAAIRPGRPAYLIHFVTHRCNGRCPFCFNRRQESSPADELTPGEVEKIAARWPGLIQLTLTGGEPFLRDDLADLIAAWAGSGIASLTIASNGYLTDRIVPAVEKTLARFPRLLLDLDLSLDGPPPLHDRLRGLPGAHERVLATARALAPLQERRRGFRLGATLTVSAANREAAEATALELRQGGLFRRVQALWVRGRPFEPATAECDFAVYERCLEALRPPTAAGLTARAREALSRLVRETVRKTVREGRSGLRCLAGRTMVMLDPYGRVYPCEMLPQLAPAGAPAAGLEDWSLGNLRELDYDIGRVMAGERARKAAAWIERTRCSCSFECAAYNSLVFNPASWPRVLREIARGLRP